jgi:ribonuclease P protein component
VLAKEFRLHKEKDILKILRIGRRRRNEVLQIIYIPGQAMNSRACVVVSKKITKKAHERNKIRRQIQALLPIYLRTTERPLDIIIRVNSSAGLKQENFNLSLKNLWPNHGQPRPTHNH